MMAARSADRSVCPEVTLGVLPGTGGTQRLPRLIGTSRALDLMITGRLLTPEEALPIGLVNYVYPKETLRRGPAWRTRRRSPTAPSRAVSLIKRSVMEGVEMPLTAGLALERELQNRLFITDDAKEGISAFIEKRKPSLRGTDPHPNEGT